MSLSSPVLDESWPVATDWLEAMHANYRRDEAEVVEALLKELYWPKETVAAVEKKAAALVKGVRAKATDLTPVEALLQAYPLSSPQGLALMALAEALLRVKDRETAARLVHDKLADLDWGAAERENRFLQVSDRALQFAQKVLGKPKNKGFMSWLVEQLGHGATPFVLGGVRRAVRLMSHNFILGQTIQDAMSRAARQPEYLYSFDMLGEGAVTFQDGERFYRNYLNAIYALGKRQPNREILGAPSISVKLSALYPRFETSQRNAVLTDLTPKLAELCRQARLHNLQLTVDAEEADRLELSLAVIEQVLATTDLSGWNGLGLAVQAYQKRAPQVIDWVIEKANTYQRRFIVRLVKGAYWDSEIKWAQEDGLDYPLFTRKANTDVSYLACAQKLLAHEKEIYPAFGTHNAHTVAAIMHMAGNAPFELQRLQGMGRPLSESLLESKDFRGRIRIYAPVGNVRELLPYLVRRLLENGANSSFVHQIVDTSQPIKALSADPVSKVREFESKSHPNLSTAANMFGAERRNSTGFDFSDPLTAAELETQVQEILDKKMGSWKGRALIGGTAIEGDTRDVFDPADHRRKIGTISKVGTAQVDQALAIATEAFPAWAATPVEERAKALEKAADLLEKQRVEFMALLAREGGRTLDDAVSEVREAVDFCRYYAAQARHHMASPRQLPGPVGESNELSLHGRGVFVCISPWNFPLAIFMGQVTAALAAGNAVVAKPAEFTPLVAHKAIKLLHKAGIPPEVLHLIIGDGQSVGAPLTEDLRCQGIAFTGSTATAQRINLALAERGGAIAPLIAETGGQNACIMDSSALPDQVAKDVVMGAFRSAGQRCSATRVLFVQDDVADRMLEMLAGAVQTLRVGDPLKLKTDVGPVISLQAAGELTTHIGQMRSQGRLIAQTPLPVDAVYGNFVAPTVVEIDRLDLLEREVFGPILHVIRYKARHLDQVCTALRKTGYGLTLGIHSRSESNIDYIRRHTRVGNTYVNRSQIGAVVGVQPFGGEGLSGTGPKAGGPHYIPRFCVERTFTVNTTAAGGNASLLCLEE